MSPIIYITVLVAERQIQGDIPRHNIRGIMIPDAYFSTPLTQLKVCRLDDKLVSNIENLDSFVKHEFSCSLMSCPKIRQYYEGPCIERMLLRGHLMLLLGEMS